MPERGVQQASFEFRDGKWVRRQTDSFSHPVLAKAEELLLKGENEAAIDVLEDFLDSKDLHPDMHRKALLMAAEAHYALGEFVPARDMYEQILEKYPGTDEASTAAVRLLQIARHWLAVAESDDSAVDKLLPVGRKDRPFVDVDGHAIKILEFIQEREPGSPVADDALMTAGDYYFRKRQYRQATLYYDLLIDAYPKSEFLAEAYLKAAEARLNVYDGADYDKRPLEEARRLLETAATQFPELQDKRPEIYRRLHELVERQAERDFQVARFYERIGKANAALVYYQLVIRDHPETEWARRAEQRIAQLGLREQEERAPGFRELIDRITPEAVFGGDKSAEGADTAVHTSDAADSSQADTDGLRELPAAGGPGPSEAPNIPVFPF